MEVARSALALPIEIKSLDAVPSYVERTLGYTEVCLELSPLHENMFSLGVGPIQIGKDTIPSEPKFILVLEQKIFLSSRQGHKGKRLH